MAHLLCELTTVVTKEAARGLLYSLMTIGETPSCPVGLALPQPSGSELPAPPHTAATGHAT